MKRWRPLGVGLLLLGSAVSASPVVMQAASCDETVGAASRTDQRPDGNRLVLAHGLAGIPQDIALDGTPTWVLPHPGDGGALWIVVLDDGSVVSVDSSADDLTIEHLSVDFVTTDIPPLVAIDADCTVTLLDGHQAQSLFDDALPDARLVSEPDGHQAALTGPTERYPHGVLGDALEGSAVSVILDDGSSVRIEVAPNEVIEGTAPILADISGDSEPEVIVTVSDEDVGARLRVYDLEGALVAESEPIGRGFRWRHQIGVAALGPEGISELIAVRTPHIGGVVEAFRLRDDRLELVATEPGFSSHRIGSRNLDMALLADVDGDGRPDVVVPTDDMRTIGVLARVSAGFEILGGLPLDGTLATNVAATTADDGRLVLAAGTSDGRLRIFR